jgi:hypothetical protein
MGLIFFTVGKAKIFSESTNKNARRLPFNSGSIIHKQLTCINGH